MQRTLPHIRIYFFVRVALNLFCKSKPTIEHLYPCSQNSCKNRLILVRKLYTLIPLKTSTPPAKGEFRCSLPRLLPLLRTVRSFDATEWEVRRFALQSTMLRWVWRQRRFGNGNRRWPRKGGETRGGARKPPSWEGNSYFKCQSTKSRRYIYVTEDILATHLPLY